MFIVRQIGLVFGVLVGLFSAQLPEFAQQYAQRLGGAIDELQRIVSDFDRDARTNWMTRSQGLERLAGDPDPFVKQRGRRMQETTARLIRLQEQQTALQQAGPVGRVAIVARDFDTGVAQRAWGQFKPAMPFSLDGLLAGLVGFAAGLGLWKLLGWPWRRFRQRKQQVRA